MQETQVCGMSQACEVLDAHLLEGSGACSLQEGKQDFKRYEDRPHFEVACFNIFPKAVFNMVPCLIWPILFKCVNSTAVHQSSRGLEDS